MNRRALGCLFEGLETIVLTLVIYLLIVTFVAQPYQVEMESMETTIEPGQYLLVDKVTPAVSDYKRGDIVVFNPPASVARPDKKPFIKRVLGVGGDLISVHDGHVFVNGKQLSEPYLNGDVQTTVPSGTQTWTVPDGQLFVMGDNRPNSTDSRSFGPIAKSSVIGRAWLRYWPLSAFGAIGGARYPELDPSPAPSPAGSPTAAPTASPAG